MSEEPINFQVDLTKVDTSRPCPQTGDYISTLTKIEVKRNKDGDGNNLVATFAFDNSCRCVPDGDGNERELKPGYELTRYYNLQPGAKEKDDPAKKNDWMARVVKLYDGMMGTKDKDRPDLVLNTTGGTFKQLEGRKCILNGAPKEDPEFGLKWEVKKISPYNG